MKRMLTKKTAILILAGVLFTSFLNAQTAPDINGDGTVNILVIGTTQSIKGTNEAFAPNQISIELENILTGDASISSNVNIVAEDIYRTKNVTTGIAAMSTANLDYYCHSLTQYYYWPDSNEMRMDNLMGANGTDWDYVVIGADPYMITHLPGYYSLGVNKVAAKVAQGGAVPLLLMPWPKDPSKISHFEEFTYRTADGAKVQLQNVPAGLAWNALPANLQDVASAHPTPNGAYVAAASIYSHILNRSASFSQYVYNDSIANIAQTTLVNAGTQTHYTGLRTFISPYKECGVIDSALVYNHGGTSTENGILGGLQWCVSVTQKTLQFGATAHFNYGRSSMGSTHLYDVDSTKFDYSFGYPLHDDRSTGNVSMLYGLDQRVSETDVETDLGVALNMIRQSELPNARNVPLRTIVAQMLEQIPGVDIHRDGWHMSYDLDKAIGAYIYTMVTGECALAGIAPPADSSGWRTYMAHKIGYETAWNLMHLEGVTPCYSQVTSASSINAAPKDNDFLVYPNPTNGNFSIDLGENYSSATVSITDIMGRQVQPPRNSNRRILDFTLDQPAGVYLVIIDSANSRSTIKLVKQ